MATEWKSSKQWRKEGFATMFRQIYGGLGVFLVKRTTREAWVTLVCNGAWLNATSLDAAPWKRAELTREMHVALDDCYCDRGVDLCDFCSSMRRHMTPTLRALET